MTGASFRDWREQRGLSQAAAAKLIGWSKPSIQRYERDPKSKVPLYIALACAARSVDLPPIP
jgi:transcriptional regulator with XRE-family HTH domain